MSGAAKFLIVVIVPLILILTVFIPQQLKRVKNITVKNKYISVPE